MQYLLAKSSAKRGASRHADLLRAARRSGAVLLLALANLLALVASSQLPTVSAEPEAEVTESLTVDWFSLPDSPRAQLRLVQVRHLPRAAKRELRGACRRTDAAAFFTARAAGHRWSNGLLAPLKC